MKNRAIFTLVVAVILIFTACSNPASAGKLSATKYGTVRIAFDDGPARTIYPNKDFDTYVYTFTPDGGAAQVLTPIDGAFTLQAGVWHVRVDAYVGAVAPVNLAASGEADFTLAAQEAKVVSVTLAANETTGAGTFSWHILYPAGTTVETFTLRKLPGLTDVALNPEPGERTMTGTVTDVPAGAYMLDIRLVNDGLYAGANEIVYIYALLTTEYGSLATPIIFEGQDFLGVFTDLNDVAQYLNEHTGGNSAANSILLPLAYDLGYMPEAGSGWQNLLDVIAAAGKYVALDLSACTMDGTDFDPANSVTTGKDKIVSIDLPDVAASIAGASSGSSGFSGSFGYFSSLTAVTAKYVLTVGNQAFYDPANHPNNNPSAVSSLTTVSFSASAEISYNPFNGCLNLTTFKLFGTGPLSVIEDGKAVVRNNTELITYPSASGNITINTITSISDNAFARCANLTGVSFPAVTSVAYNAFQACNNIESVSFGAMTSANISFDLSRSKLKNVSFAVATSIGNNTFNDCTNLESVYIPAATSIGDNAFRNCTSLESVDFPVVTSIGSDAFNACTSLESVSFPAVTSIDLRAFYNCTSLESVSFPAATSIGDFAFYGCTSLTSVSFPASANIYYNPFGGCINLTNITVTGIGSLSVSEGGKVLLRNGMALVAYPSASGTITMNAITSIGVGAFDSCNLESVSFPAVTSIGIEAFYQCTGLESVSFPAATSIGDYAFIGCTSLTNVFIPAAISIGNGAFNDTGTTALTVTLGATPPTLGTEIFFYVDIAKNVTVQFPFIGFAAYGNVPADTEGQNWGNAFRGMGWNGTAYLDGAVNENITLTYDLIGGLTGEEGAVAFVYYWVDEQDVIATAGDSSGNAFTLSFGESLTITANGSGYTNQRWFIDGVEDSGQAGNAAYVFSSAGKAPKRYTVGLIVEKGGKYYNVNFAVTVG
jgi:hypothetical protein